MLPVLLCLIIANTLIVQTPSDRNMLSRSPVTRNPDKINIRIKPI